MGFSNLSILYSIISQQYYIQSQINNLMQRKFQLSHTADMLGNYQSQLLNAGQNSMSRVRLMNFMPNGTAQFSNSYFSNVVGPGGQLVTNPNPLGQIDVNGAPPPFIVENNYGQPVGPGQFAPIDAQNPMAGALGPGEMYMNSNDANTLYNSYLTKINNEEKVIDQQLEQLQAKLPALQKQMEMFEKFTQENIGHAFKNNFSG